MKKFTPYRAGKVRRWHTHHSMTQTVADHSHGVALIIINEHPNPSTNLLKAAIVHDLGEWLSGDLPSYGKVANPKLKEVAGAAEASGLDHLGLAMPDLNKEEKLWLKYADLKELYLFAMMHAKGPDDIADHVDLIEVKFQLKEVAQKLEASS